MTPDQQRLICPDCGLAYTDASEHRDWHVDQRMKRLSDADLLCGFQSALSRLEVTSADAVLLLPWRLPSERRAAAPAPEDARRAGEGVGL